MNILISNSGEQPIYEQIANQIKGKILSGELSQNDALPSMRALAKDLRISVITTRRAYEELEKEGFITSVTGRGSFVTGRNLERVKEENLRRMEDMIQKTVALAITSGVSLNELTQTIKMYYRGDSE